MTNKTSYFFLHKQILLMLGLSLLPGLGYVFLDWLNNIILPTVIWYTLIALVCFWGYRIYSSFQYEAMTPSELDNWYKQLQWFFYISFSLWTLVFILYAGETNSKMHYIAIFTQLGTSVVASALLYPDKKLYTPIIIILMVPLTIYFAGIQQWYGYVLCIMYYVLCIMYYVLCIMYYVLCIMYYVLCIMYYVLCIMYFCLCLYGRSAICRQQQ